MNTAEARHILMQLMLTTAPCSQLLAILAKKYGDGLLTITLEDIENSDLVPAEIMSVDRDCYTIKAIARDDL